MQRSDVRFRSGGEDCAAWFYLPDGDGPHACVVMAHGFGGTREARLDAFAERFAEAGLAVVLFDYRHFGASGGRPRQLLDIRRQHQDYRAAVAYARSREDVDGARIVLWGTSLSGGHVAEVAATDRRVVAAISQNPFFDGLWALKAAGPANCAKLTAAGLRDQAAAIFGRTATIPIVGAPGTIGAMTQPTAKPGYEAIVPQGAAWENRVAARVALRIGLYRPLARAAGVSCPWLLCLARHDDVTPVRPAERAASRAPRSETLEYDAGHWDVYVPPLFDRIVGDQIAFLRRHVPGLERSGPAAGSG